MSNLNQFTSLMYFINKREKKIIFLENWKSWLFLILMFVFIFSNLVYLKFLSSNYCLIHLKYRYTYTNEIIYKINRHISSGEPRSVAGAYLKGAPNYRIYSDKILQFTLFILHWLQTPRQINCILYDSCFFIVVFIN